MNIKRNKLEKYTHELQDVFGSGQKPGMRNQRIYLNRQKLMNMLFLLLL